MTDSVGALRRFNRSFTQRIGVLDDRFLGLNRPLAASRLLWEIGDQTRPVSDLRTHLGLDSAYLSRLLRTLEGEGLAETVADPSDGRRRAARLTPAGTKEWGELERRSDELAKALIAPLTDTQQDQLASALFTVERLLAAAEVELTAVEPTDPAAVVALEAYFGELNKRFDEGFDPGDTVTADASSYRRPNGEFVLARRGDELVGCGAVHRMEPQIAEIKRMWIAPNWRGLQLGKRMLHRLEQGAAELGCQTVRLDTNSVLEEAIAMYESAGYQTIDRYNDNPYAKRWFEKSLGS